MKLIFRGLDISEEYREIEFNFQNYSIVILRR